MKTLDFNRSFVTFVTHGHGNNARIQVECRCTLRERLATHWAERTYLLVASCKSEDTFGSGDLFLQPNYDFCAIFSDVDTAARRAHADVSLEDMGVERPFCPETQQVVDESAHRAAEYTIIRAHAGCDVGGKETGDTLERFHDIVVQLAEVDAEDCEDDDEVIHVTLQGVPIVGVTTISDPASGREAILEYPIKTMNVNDIDTIWQVDTGPLVFPDLSSQAERRIEWLDLAFIVYNRLDRAEFIIQAPTAVEGAADVLVPHYSRAHKCPATNRIVALSS